MKQSIPALQKHLDYLAIADPEAAKRMQGHLEGTHFSGIAYQMDQVVEEVIKALAVEVSYGRTFADGIGRLLAKGTTAHLERYLNLVKAASDRGPTLAGIVARHLVPVLTCKDTNLADRFDETIRIMLKKGTYTLKAPLETLSAFIEKGQLASAYAFMDLLVATYSLDLTYNRSLYLTYTLPRAVSDFNSTRRLWQIRGWTRVIAFDVRLSDAYLQGLTAGLDLLPEKALYTFLDQAFLRYKKDSERGSRYLSLDAKQAMETCRSFQVAVPLATVRSGLERYLQARTGMAIPIRKLSCLPMARNENEPRSPMVRCDGQVIYLPEEIDIMDRREDNADLYKLLVRLEAGAMEFGTYELDVEKAKGSVIVDPPATLSESSAKDSDLTRFLNGFDKPTLALNLFTIFEHARIARRVKKHYPGLFKRIIQALKNRDLHFKTGHPTGGDLYPLYQVLVMDNNLPAAQSIKKTAQAMLERFNQMTTRTAKDTSETSARLAMEFYPKFTSHYNQSPNLSPFSLDLAFGRQLEPERFGSFHNTYCHMAKDLKNHLIKRNICVYRSDIQNFLIKHHGRVSVSELRLEIIDSSVTATTTKSICLSDRDLKSLICNYGLVQPTSSVDDADTYRYREWDHCMDDYLQDHVRVLERIIPETSPAFYRRTLTLFPGLVRHIRYAFELLRPENMTILRQWREGDAFDYRALLDYAMDRKAGLMPSDRLFIKRIKQVRDVATLLLVDLSRSTANAVDSRGTQVLDVEKQAIVLLCEALEKVGDRFAIAGFSGTGPLGVDYYRIKDINETFTETVKGRISAMSPQRSTRMGAAIRHATSRLSPVQARVKLIVVLSDGFPNDLAYKGAYAVEDTRRAVMEARTEGTHVRAITVNAGDNGQLDRLYGATHHTRIGNIHDLPGQLVRVYSALTLH